MDNQSDRKLVYVVEDDEEQIFIMRMLLSGAEFDVVTETNADKVLDAVETLRPHVVLLDVMLPSAQGLDGFELCSRIRQNAALEGVKVIIVSAIAEGLGSSKARMISQVGADDFIVKPYDPPALIRRIRQVLAG